MTKKYFASIVLGLLIFSFVSRFWLLGKVPGSLYWDEQAILLDAWSVAKTGLDWHGQTWLQAIFASYGDFKLPVYIWSAALAVKLFGATAWAVRLPSALAGFLGVVLAGLIAADLNSIFSLKLSQAEQRGLVLSTLIVATTSFWGIHFSHVAFEAHLGQFLLALSWWLFGRGALMKDRFHKRFQLIYIIFACVFAASSIFTYYSVRFVFPFLMIATGWIVFHIHPTQRKMIVLTSGFWLASVLAAVLIFNFSPLAKANRQLRLSTTSILSMRSYVLKANQIQQQFRHSLIARVLYHRNSFQIDQFLTNVFTHLNPNFLYLTGDHNLRHGTGERGLMSLVLLPFGVLGLYSLWKLKKSLWLLLLIWWGLALLPASVPMTVPHALRSLNAWLPVTLIHAFGLFYLWRLKTKLWFYMIVSCLAVDTLLFLYEYKTQYALDSRAYFQSGYTQVAQYVAQKQDRYLRIWIIPFDGRWFLWLLSAQNKLPTQLSHLVRDGYGVQQIENVLLQRPTCQDLHLENQLLLGTRPAVNDLIQSCQFKPTQYKLITDQTHPAIVAIWNE